MELRGQNLKFEGQKLFDEGQIGRVVFLQRRLVPTLDKLSSLLRS